MNAIKRAWNEHRWLSLAIAICLVLVLVIAIRLLMFWHYWESHKEAKIEPWMTIGYVARSYDLSKNALFELFRKEFELKRGERETIAQIAKRLGRSEQEIIDELYVAIGDDEVQQK